MPGMTGLELLPKTKAAQPDVPGIMITAYGDAETKRTTTDLSQRVESLEVNHAPATEVGPNDDFGLKVVGHVREHDVVYKVRP